MDNHYSILGLNKDSSTDEIKKRYRELAMLHHPDKGGNEEMFKKIVFAYSILSDKTKKTEYDNKQQKATSPFAAYYASKKTNQTEKNKNSSGSTTKSNNWDEFKKTVKNKYDSIEDFNEWYSTTGKHDSFYESIKNDETLDIHIQHTVQLKDFVMNSSGSFTFGRKTVCSCSEKSASGITECRSCNGTGMVGYKVTCILCNGKGKITYGECKTCNGKKEYWETVTTDIQIALYRNILIQGDSHKIILDNMGNQSTYNGPRGKLYLTISYIPDPKFTIRGNDIIYSKKMTLTELFETDGLEFRWMDETIKINIENVLDYMGMPIRVKNKGMKESGLFERGDLVVMVNIDMNLSTLLKNERVKNVIMEEYSKLNKKK